MSLNDNQMVYGLLHFDADQVTEMREACVELDETFAIEE